MFYKILIETFQAELFSCFWHKSRIICKVKSSYIGTRVARNMTPMNCVKTMKGVSTPHTGHRAYVQLQGQRLQEHCLDQYTEHPSV